MRKHADYIYRNVNHALSVTDPWTAIAFIAKHRERRAARRERGGGHPGPLGGPGSGPL